MIVSADAVADPKAMMIISLNAHIALLAVPCSILYLFLAGFAVKL